ncbi:MAG: hypothetical protein ACR2O5_06505, partial [Thiogranum sp.]
MILRWLKFASFGLLAVALLLFAAMFTITRTETGAGWVLGIAQDQMEGLKIGGHRGSVHGGLELQQLHFAAPAFTLQAEKLDVAVRTEWFPFAVRIEWLEAQGLVY